MSKRPLICAAVAGVLLIGQAPSMAATEDPTALSGLDVVVKKTTRLSELEVSVPLCGKAKPTTRPAAEDPRFKPGNNIVQRAGPFDDTPPKVVSSFPGRSDVVRPGLMVLRVTFDRPMTCLGTIRNHPPFPDPCPPPLQAPMISRDKRTFLTVCKIEANRHYGLWLNNFNSAGGRALPPYELEFDSSGMADITKVEEALAQDRWLRKTASPGSSTSRQ